MAIIPQRSKPKPESNINKLFTRKHVITPAQCQELITWAKSDVSGLHRGIKKHNLWDSKFLTTQVPLSNPIHDHLQTLWADIIKHFGFDIDFVEEYEIKCYTQGDFFESHTDNSFTITNDLDRKLTLSINLSDPSSYQGGKLVVRETDIDNKLGSCSAFPTFFRHHVDTVTQGERWVLIGWAWGPYWR